MPLGCFVPCGGRNSQSAPALAGFGYADQVKVCLLDTILERHVTDSLARFRRDYSAEARAKLLEHLLCAPQTWRSASASTRAHMFMGLSPE